MSVSDLPVPPGLCGTCRFRSVNATRRGAVYLRCTAAAGRPELPKYPALPVTRCPAFEPAEEAARD